MGRLLDEIRAWLLEFDIGRPSKLHAVYCFVAHCLDDSVLSQTAYYSNRLRCDGVFATQLGLSSLATAGDAGAKLVGLTLWTESGDWIRFVHNGQRSASTDTWEIISNEQ